LGSFQAFSSFQEPEQFSIAEDDEKDVPYKIEYEEEIDFRVIQIKDVSKISNYIICNNTT
jgi:hypothetical protein